MYTDEYAWRLLVPPPRHDGDGSPPHPWWKACGCKRPLPRRPLGPKLASNDSFVFVDAAI